MKHLLFTLIFALSSGFLSLVAAQTIEAPTLGNPTWVGDHLELPVSFKGTGDLSLSISEATCPVQLATKTITLPASTMLYIAPKGRSGCLFNLALQNDQGDDAKWKLEISAVGDTGFSLVVKAIGSRDPSATPEFGARGSVDVHGGWGALRVDGTVQIDSSTLMPDGNLLLQYEDSRLQLADDSGARDHPAGDIGRGLYFLQGFGISSVGQFALGLAIPFGQTVRVGAGWRGEYACGQISTDLNFSDPIFAVQAGAQGARASLSYRPNAGEKWGFGLEYRNADWYFNATATEARGSAEVRGFTMIDGLGWGILKAKAGYDGTKFTTSGNADSNDFGIRWEYNATNPNVFLEYRLFDLAFLSELRLGADFTYSATPGYVRLEAIYDDGAFEIDLVGKINTARAIGVSGHFLYSLPLEGRLTLGVKFDVPDVTYRSNYALSGVVNYGTGGWLISLEMGVSSIFHPSAFVASLSITNWSFIGVTPPTPTVRFVDSTYTPTLNFSSPCN